ncbi:MAG: glycosyltransferase family 39 protein [Candidatus Methanofastidiosia archaeon]|jgi:hypothetical protein
MDTLVNQDMVLRHKFVIAFGVLAVCVLGTMPTYPVFSLLFLYFPGVVLVSQLKKNLDAVEGTALPLLVGMCVWIIFTYWSSPFPLLYWYTILVLSGISAAIADTLHIHISRPQYTLLFLIVCCIFMGLYTYPWSQFYHWVPPGDDMKYHALHIANITANHSLPGTYGPLYPELHTLSYPLGYHSIISVVTIFTTPSVSYIVLTTILIMPLSCFSFYFLGKSLFNHKTGVYAAFSVSFLSLFFHRLLFTSTYPNLLGITFQVLALSLLWKGLHTKKHAYTLVSIVVLAAAGLTHSYIFLINGFFLGLLTIFFLVKKEISKVKILILVGCGILMASIPFFVQLEFHSLSAVEMKTFATWYAEDAINSVSDAIQNVSVLSPFLLICSIMGLLLTFKKMTFQTWVIVTWIVSILILPVLSAFPVQYPGWYTISANRVFFHVFAPLCVLSGKFLSDVHTEHKKGIYFIGGLILLSVGMHANVFNSFSPDPVTHVQMNPIDDFVMTWIADNTDNNAVILNTGPAVDCSSWVPVLCKRRVVFPYFSGHRGDNCIEIIKAHLKREDLRVVTHAPDSEKALQALKKYGIDYVYIPAWRKRYYYEIDPQKLVKSPLYKPVIKKGDAYLFQVVYNSHPETHYFAIKEKENISVDETGYTLACDPVMSPDAQGQFFVQVEYTDSTYGYIDIYDGFNRLETVFTFETGENRIILIPLSGQEITVRLYADPACKVDKIAIFYGIKHVIPLSDQVALKGDWCTAGSTIVGPAGVSTLRIYVINPEHGITLVYTDTGHGNVDINISDIERGWPGAKVLYRLDTGEIKKVFIPTERYIVLVFGVYVNGNNFFVQDIVVT